jgi:cell division protein FtsZ
MADFNFGEETNMGVFNFQQGTTSIIKVIGVGGGGSNAVNHMYNEGIHDVTFVVCNTDSKALQDSPVPDKIQLGTEGLGAGNRPENGRRCAEESIEDVKRMLSDGTKMVFITAGMGGGTGTGAAPLIAKTAKEMGILTVGIVTIPFRWEGLRKINQALDGVEEIGKNVDALLVVNNERLLQIYNDISLDNAFDKADDTLCNAARSISEIITMHGRINIDFQDVKTVLKDGGVAIMSTGYGTGEGRVTKAIQDALHSPLLNDNDVYRSKKILLHVIHSGDAGEGSSPLMIEEMTEINEFMQRFENKNIDTKWGYSKDESLKDRVKITILASGFGLRDINTEEMNDRINKNNEETRRLTAEREEQEAANAVRVIQYYGQTNGINPPPRPIYSYIFNDEDLDDENIISAIETSPTYKRSKETLKQLKDVANKSAATVETSAVINFA